jgi:hypothetical protein
MREVFLHFGVAPGLGLLAGFRPERMKGELGGVHTSR